MQPARFGSVSGLGQFMPLPARSFAWMLALVFSPLAVRAQTVVNWLPAPLSSDWNTGPGNWSPATVPGISNVAWFGVSSVTSLTFSNNTGSTLVGSLVFLSGGSAYTFTVTPSATAAPQPIFGILGTGIVNLSGVTQSFVTNGAQAGASGGGEYGYGILAFYSNATAGTNTLITNQGGAVAASYSATNSGNTSFNNTSSAGSATIVNNATTVDGAGGGVTLFLDHSSAGSATVTSNGAASALGGPPGEGATFAAGMTIFDNNADAGTSTLIANGGASGGSGGTIRFTGTATGGTASVQLNGNGVLELFGLTTPSLTIGSLSGAGNVYLGANNLTVGANNASTTFSGVIADGGNPGETGSPTTTGGSVTKTGTGTLTLTGTNTYTGGTTISGGFINFNALGNFGSGTITLDGGGLQWASGSTVDVSPQLAALGASGGTLDTNGNNVSLATGLTGAGALTKIGKGTLTLAGASTYSGGTTISDGTLTLGNGGTSGSITGDVVNNSAFVFNRSDNVTYAGNISGTGTLTLTGAGNVALTGATSYTGATTIGTQTLAFAPSSGTTTLAGDVSLAGGTLQLLGNAGLTGTLSGNGAVVGSYGNVNGAIMSFASFNNFSGTMTLSTGLTLGSGTLSANITILPGMSGTLRPLTFSGTDDLTISGQISGMLSNVQKTGAGAVTLTGANSFTSVAPTAIYAGALYANNTSGSALGTVAVQVKNGATLGGTGSIGGVTTFESGSYLAPGVAGAPGTLTFTNGLTLNDGAILDFRLGGKSDMVLVTGGTFTGPASEAGATFYFTAGSGFTAGTYDLIDNNLGTLTGLDPRAFGIGNSIAGYDLVLSINDNGGLNLIATAAAIPEPATYGALAGVAVMGLAFWRRRLRSRPA